MCGQCRGVTCENSKQLLEDESDADYDDVSPLQDGEIELSDEIESDQEEVIEDV